MNGPPDQQPHFTVSIFRNGNSRAVRLPKLFDPEGVTQMEITARLSARGEVIGGNDPLIAGHAFATEARLVTNSRREFDRVDGLVVEDWANPPSIC